MSTKETKSTEVAVVEPVNQLPAHLQQDMNDVAGLGNSEDSRDRSMPFFSILQKGSPQVDPEAAEYISGAIAGMCLNTATGQIYSGKEGVPLIMCGSSRQFVEWKPNRQGWAGSHPFDIDHVRKLGAKKTKVMVEGKERIQITMPNSNILTETLYVFVILDGAPAVIGAASTAIGPMRKWNDYRLAQKFPGSRNNMPSFAKSYLATTIYEKNESGNWYNWAFKDGGFVTDASLYAEAKKFAIAIATGEVAVGRPDEFDSPTETNNGSRGTNDDGIEV